ncbi:ribosomal protein L13 [Aureobasidium subglaciale]|nr:ribosomal protein L13 [Aureobasidium subglaciale]
MSERYRPQSRRREERVRRTRAEKIQTNLAYSRAWHLVDVGADSRPLGRIASQIAITLMGKHKPIWDPSTDCGDYVVAVGLHDLHTTGKKRFQKKYYSHTTRPGSLKEITMDRMMEKWGGSEVLRRAVRVFEGVAHPYKQNIIKDYTRPSIAQQPEVKTAFAKQKHQ